MKTARIFLIVVILTGAAAYVCAQKGANTAAAPSQTATPSRDNSQATQNKHGAEFLRKRIKPKDSDDVRKLAKELRESKGDTRSYILEDLAGVSPNATHLKPAYLELLDDKDENVQEAGVRVAAKMKIKEGIPKIRAILKKQPRYKFTQRNDIRDIKRIEELGYTCEAAKALIELDDFDSVDEIISRDLFMMNSGGQFLAKFGAKVLPKVLQHANEGEMQLTGARSTIRFIRDEAAVPELIKLLNGEDQYYAASAAESLSVIINNIKSIKMRQQIATQLEGKFSSKSSKVRSGVYAGLLATDSEKYGKQIFDILAKEDGLTQLSLMYYIAQYRIKGLGGFLKQFIRNDELKNPIYHDQRGAAARALYLTTGEKVQYKGLEEDQKRDYSNPYVNK